MRVPFKFETKTIYTQVQTPSIHLFLICNHMKIYYFY
jgi:hypothetical protein